MDHGVPRSVALLMFGASLVFAVPACKSAPQAEAPVTTAPSFESQPAHPAEKVEETSGFKEPQPETDSVKESSSSLAEKLNTKGILKSVHFDFDKYDLRPDAMRTLGDDASAMKQYALKVRIEGHCDERGTVEYNLALGEKRARAARDYLVSLGTPSQRLSIISYGKERPLEPGHNEDAWAANRRAELVFLAE